MRCEVNSTEAHLLGKIFCPDCGHVMTPTVPCKVCGYEHKLVCWAHSFVLTCGGPAEACMVAGCPECGTPNAKPTGGAPSAE